MRPLVRGLHDLRTRKGGAIRFVEFHLIVPATINVAEAHDISDRIEEVITSRNHATHVTTHIEPCRRPCPETCLPGCFLTEKEREYPIARFSQGKFRLPVMLSST
ncbi:MAG: cation transporter dimerization domain-containing protein [bacterium]